MAAKAKSGEKNPLKFVDVETDKIKWGEKAVSKAIDDGYVFQDTNMNVPQMAMTGNNAGGSQAQFLADQKESGVSINANPGGIASGGLAEAEKMVKNKDAGLGYVDANTRKRVDPSEVLRKRSALDNILKQYR